MPVLEAAGQEQAGDQGRGEDVQPLGGDHEPPAVDAVRDRAGERADYRDRRVAEEPDQGDLPGGVSQLESKPAGGEDVEPAGEVPDEGRRPKKAIPALPER